MDKEEIDEIFDSMPGETWTVGDNSEAVKDVVKLLKSYQEVKLRYEDKENEEYRDWIKTLLWVVNDS